MSNRRVQLVMRNDIGCVINRSDPMPYPNLTIDKDIVEAIRQWSRIGFATGDSFTIEEVQE